MCFHTRVTCAQNCKKALPILHFVLACIAIIMRLHACSLLLLGKLLYNAKTDSFDPVETRDGTFTRRIHASLHAVLNSRNFVCVMWSALFWALFWYRVSRS